MLSFISIILILTILWSLIKGIDLIYYTQHLCTQFRIAEIKAMSMSNLSILVIVVKFVHSCKQEFNSHAKFMVQTGFFIVCCENIYSCYHIQKGINGEFHPWLAIIVFEMKICVFSSEQNKQAWLGFLYWQILSLICLLRNHVTSLLSHQFSKTACKDGDYCK